MVDSIILGFVVGFIEAGLAHTAWNPRCCNAGVLNCPVTYIFMIVCGVLAALLHVLF